MECHGERREREGDALRGSSPLAQARRLSFRPALDDPGKAAEITTTTKVEASANSSRKGCCTLDHHHTEADVIGAAGRFVAQAAR